MKTDQVLGMWKLGHKEPDCRLIEKILKRNGRSTRKNQKRKKLTSNRMKLPTRKRMIAKISTSQVAWGVW